MAAADHLGIQFRLNDLPDLRQVTAHTPDGSQVGHLSWHDSSKPDQAESFFAEPGEVHQIKVNPGMQRQGIGSGLWDYAKGIDPGIRHSYTQSDAGRAWSAKVGGQ